MFPNALGIDFGNSKTGVSINRMSICFGYTTIHERDIKKLAFKISEIVEKENIDTIIVGYPENFDGSLSKQCLRVEKFISFLKKNVNSKIIKWDEFLTTKRAIENINNYGIKKSKKKLYEDLESARIILESYIDTLNI